jgi:hypothetical protein
MEFVYHFVTICVNETSWAHVWRLRSRYLETGYDRSLVHRSHLVVCLVYCLWSEDEDDYGYIIMITIIALPLTLTWVNVLFVYACSSL